MSHDPYEEALEDFLKIIAEKMLEAYDKTKDSSLTAKAHARWYSKFVAYHNLVGIGWSLHAKRKYNLS